MAINEDLMLVGATGLAYFGPLGSAAPTTASAPPDAALKDFGAISDDGLTEAASQTFQSFTPWGRIKPAKRALTASERTFQLTFWESSPEVLDLYFALGGVPTVTDGAFDFAEPTIYTPDYRAMVVDTIEGENICRIYADKVEVSDRGNIVHNAQNIMGYQLTFTALDTIHRFYAEAALD